jgi:hypothetical protein
MLPAGRVVVGEEGGDGGEQDNVSLVAEEGGVAGGVAADESLPGD